MKIAFLGAGALRLVGAVDEILLMQQVFGTTELVFMDIIEENARMMAALTEKMPAFLPSKFIVKATNNLDEAIGGADFVYCSLRVGGVRALERDQRIGLKYGFHGHDDFGPSAVMLTFRTVPVILDIAERMERLCPKAWLLIFTNPITTLVDATNRYSQIQAVGLCGGVNNIAWDMDHLFNVGLPCQDLVFQGGGLNHFSWATADSTYKGRPLMDFIREHFDDLPNRPGAQKCLWSRAAPLVDLYDAMFMNNGHQHHYFYHDEMVKERAELFEKEGSQTLRSSLQEKHRKEAKGLAKKRVIENFWDEDSFENFAHRPFGDIGVNFIKAIRQDVPEKLTVTTPNKGHIKDVMVDVPVEATSIVCNNQIKPLGLDPVPNSLKELCNAIAWHQRMTVDATVRKDRRELFKALLSEPTIRSYTKAEKMFSELWAASEQQQSTS